MGHMHGGRTFPPSLHGELASIIIVPICLQLLIGIYLKLHVNEDTTFRAWTVFLHWIVGLSYPAFGWTQVLFGLLVSGGLCPLDGTSNTLKCAEPVRISLGVVTYLMIF
jgi:hypothetical protein